MCYFSAQKHRRVYSIFREYYIRSKLRYPYNAVSYFRVKKRSHVWAQNIVLSIAMNDRTVLMLPHTYELG